MYPSDKKPRRRLQAVPTMEQMIRRRAASPGGNVKNGVGLMGTPGSVSRGGGRRLDTHQGGYASPLPGSDPGGRPNPPVNPFHPAPQGGPTTGDSDYAPPLQTPDKAAYSGLNPNTLLPSAPGPVTQRNPLEHLDWWASVGWQYNPKTGRFRFVGVPEPGQGSAPGGRPNPGGGGQNPPGGGDNGGGGTTVPPGGDNVAGDANGDGIPDDLPLDSYFEAQRRQLNDALMAKLGYIDPQREIVAANQGLQEARLGTNEQVDTAHLLESLAGRGAFGGGVQARDQGYLGTDYLRQRQDLGQNVASQYSDLARQESEAQMGYSSGLMEALLALAQRQAESQYAPTPGVTGTGGLPPLLDNTLGGGGGGGQGGGKKGGGGGGNWEPSWTPKWKPPKQRKKGK